MKILEKIIYNRLYKHLTENNILYIKDKYAIIQLLDHINDNFENNQYTLGIFMDLSRDFDLVNHKILIAKLENYDIKGNNVN